MELKVDPARLGLEPAQTGFYVRAKGIDGKWQSVDIEFLDRASLIAWLRSGNQLNVIAEGVVLGLLGHDPLTAEERMGGIRAA